MRGTNRDVPGVNSENSSSHPQFIRRLVSIMKRGHAQRESKVLCQQLRQVEMNDGVTGGREEERCIGRVCVEEDEERAR